METNQTKESNHLQEDNSDIKKTSDSEAVPEPIPGRATDANGVVASANTNQTNNSLITTSLIVLIVFLLFIMLMLSIGGKSSNSAANNHGLTALELNNQQLRNQANAERSRNGLPPLPPSSHSAFTTAERLSKDASSLASLASSWEAELAAKNTAISELQAQMASRDDNTRQLYNQISTLTAKANQSTEVADQLVRLSEELKFANDQIETYRIQLSELQGRPSNDQLANLRKQLNESLDLSGKLQLKIDELIEAGNGNVDNKNYDQALAEIETLRGDNRKQRYDIQRLRAELDHSSLFIQSQKDLPAEAARLFTKLTTLENANLEQLTAAYEDIRNTMNAEIIHRQTFAKGSAKITFDREKIIEDILKKRQDRKSLFLVIGYASVSGNNPSNRELSAKRATRVASLVKILKADDQQVKAVYLGETKRFSPDAEIENQICEIWEIKI
jgi:outer membrane protein OmpA-like peptidoglycan-associated protein